MPSSHSQFDQDTRLLDALDRARLDYAVSNEKPGTITARLRDLCAVHDLPSDEGLLAKATALFLAQPSATATAIQTPASEKGAPEAWVRPRSLKDLELARAQVGRLSDSVYDPQSKWVFAFIVYVAASIGVPLVLHAWMGLAATLLIPLFGLWLRRREARLIRAAMSEVRPWLTPKDLNEGAHRQVSGAQVNLMGAKDHQTVEALVRWSRVKANHALLATIANSEVPLLMGDVRTLDANMEGQREGEAGDQAKEWRTHLKRFAQQYHTQTAGAVPWKRYDRVDRLTGQVTRAIRAQSTPFELESPYDGLQRLSLTTVHEVDVTHGELWGLWLTLERGQLGFDIRALRVRLDDQPVEQWPVRDQPVLNSSKQTVLVFRDASRCVARLRSAQRFAVELPVYANSPVVETFDVAEPNWDSPGEDLATADLDEPSRRQLLFAKVYA